MEDQYPGDNQTFYQGTLGAPKNFRGNALVGFVDLLGFSNRLIEFWEDSEVDPVAELLNVKNSVGYMGNSTAISEPVKPAVTYNSYRTMLSDALIISVALPSEETARLHDARAAFGCLVLHLQEVVGKCLRLGFATRGGIGYGGACWGPRVFTGPALVQAYRLESKVAKSARIVLGGEVVRLLEGNRRHIETVIQDDATWKFLPPWWSLTYLGVDRHLSIIPVSKESKELAEIVEGMCQRHLLQPQYLSKYRELQIGMRYPGKSNVTEKEVLVIAQLLLGRLT